MGAVLTELRICDFAIIDELQLRLAPGFTVLTGETGAGKSIIVDAVEMLLGGRADSSVVRAGCERALVEGVFRLGPEQRARLEPLLAAEGLEGDEPGTLLVGREVRLGGRNVCRINGRSVTLALLQRATQGLVDIHGQSEHLSLLQPREQLNLLDRYAGAWALRAEVAETVGQLRALQRELESLLARDREAAHRADFLQFQLDEIASAALVASEEDELQAERVRLANAEQLAALSADALAALDEGSPEAPAAADLLGSVARALESLARIDATLEPQAAASLTYQLDELAAALREYRERIEHNPRRLQAVEERLALIRRLERKYGPTVADVLAYRERAAAELHAITHSAERIEALRAQEEERLAALASQVEALSQARRLAAAQLAAGIERELGALRMEGARFGVAFEWHPDPGGVPLPADVAAWRLEVSGSGAQWAGESAAADSQARRAAFDSTGIERIEFLISPNPGEPLKPMARIASGGETSRLMLALKTVLSLADETPTLVFDEIDQGIGGRVGATVGEKLWRLTVPAGPGVAAHQVLCVTHLPQLAAFADVHVHVEKALLEGADGAERTVTRVRTLSGEARVRELAEMLGAAGEAGQHSAEEILAQAEGCKRAAQP